MCSALCIAYSCSPVDDLADLKRCIQHFQSFDESTNFYRRLLSLTHLSCIANSGSLNREEFAMLHAHLVWSGYSLASMEDCLQSLDKDGNESVSFVEYVQWLVDLGSLFLEKEL